MKLQGTVTKEKNELLFTRFGINYNAMPEVFRKGSIVYKKQVCQVLSIFLCTVRALLCSCGPRIDMDFRAMQKKETHASSCLFQVESPASVEALEGPEGKNGRRRMRYHHVVEHVDIIGDRFWEQNPHILG